MELHFDDFALTISAGDVEVPFGVWMRFCF